MTNERFNGTIRPLEKGDLLKLRPILETWIKNMITGKVIPEEVEEDLANLSGSLDGTNSREYVVAQDTNGQVIGMLGLSPLKDALKPYVATAHPIELVNAYVDKNFRAGLGVGSALVARLIESAVEKGATEILLDSGPRYRNTGWGFWDKQPGFQRVGIATNLYGPGIDAPVWRKLLV